MRIILCTLLLLLSCSRKSPDEPSSPNPTMDTDQGYAVIHAAEKQYHTGLLHIPGAETFGQEHAVFTDCGPLPDEFDLRKLGLVATVKDQGNCGSCWAFSKTGSLESAMLGAGKSLDLAEQELVSCDTAQYGCDGGMLSDFKYQISHGQATEASYPYTASDSGCKSKPVAAQGVSFQYIGTASRGPTEQELKCALYQYKTVPWITVSASSAWGSPPSSERTPYTRCGSGQTNHAVGVVGWEKISGKTYFIMKNSWGSGWGDHGYMALALGCDSFGDEVAFVEVAQPSPSPSPSTTPTPTPPGPSPTATPTHEPSPSPSPCVPPHVSVPAEVQVFAGREIELGTKEESGVSYSWTASNALVGSAATIYVTPPKDDVYKVTAWNACGQTEALVRVRIVMSGK